jgi:TM2 domain-containing membrane protein YozV
MKSKGVASVLALLFGSTGAQWFYVGQNNRGWIYLCLFYVAIPGATWALKTFTGFYFWEKVFFGWILIMLLIHIAECIYFASSGKEKFENIDKSRGGTWLLTIFAVILAVVFSYGMNYLFSLKTTIDIDNARPEFTMTSLAYSEAYITDETAFVAQYGNKVLQLEGMVISKGTDLETGEFLILESASNTSIDLKCFFDDAHQQQLKNVNKGYLVVLKGVCDGRFMQNCTLLQSESGKSESTQ